MKEVGRIVLSEKPTIQPNKKGFTLIETVIASAIALVLGVLLVSILANNTGTFYQQRAYVNQGLSLNDTLGEIDNHIRLAAAVVSGYPLADPTYQSGQNILVLKLPAISPNGNLPGVYDYVVITKDDAKFNVLRSIIYPDPQSNRESQNKVLSTILLNISFEYLGENSEPVVPTDAKTVSVTLTVSDGTGSIESSRSSTTTTRLRNI